MRSKITSVANTEMTVGLLDADGGLLQDCSSGTHVERTYGRISQNIQTIWDGFFTRAESCAKAHIVRVSVNR